MLGVALDADENTIKTSYRRLALLKHLDKDGNTPQLNEEFVRV